LSKCFYVAFSEEPLKATWSTAAALDLRSTAGLEIVMALPADQFLRDLYGALDEYGGLAQIRPVAAF